MHGLMLPQITHGQDVRCLNMPALNVSVKDAIESGDAASLRDLLAEDPARANAPIVWGKRSEISTHPLHYVSDMLFGGTLERGKETQLIAALLDAGADCNFQAPKGETALIGAASLAAEDVGLQLLDAGARHDLKGAFGETALHWAAHLGLQRLVARLIEEGSDLNLKDRRYNATPAGWAIHGRYTSTPGRQEHHCVVVALLVGAGARIEPDWLTDERVLADPRMRLALTRT